MVYIRPYDEVFEYEGRILKTVAADDDIGRCCIGCFFVTKNYGVCSVHDEDTTGKCYGYLNHNFLNIKFIDLGPIATKINLIE